MIWTAFLALVSHWRRHLLQLATLLIGLALATGLWTGVQAINAEARASYDAAASVLGQDSLDRLERGEGGIVIEQHEGSPSRRYEQLRTTLASNFAVFWSPSRHVFFSFSTWEIEPSHTAHYRSDGG